MRKILFALAALLVYGCVNEPVNTNRVEQGDGKFLTARSLESRDVIPVSDSRVAEQAQSINQFASRMYKQLVEGNKNLFFSPYSITVALGMTDAGAAGETAEQIRSTLQVTLAGEDFHAALNGLDRSLETHSDETEKLELNVVNSIWQQNGLLIKDTYLDLLARHYDAGVNLLDFRKNPESCRIIINNWVSEQTKSRINNLLPPGSINTLTELVLTNAIYFMADWLYSFNSEKTDNQEFQLLDGEKVLVPTMKLEGENGGEIKLLYTEAENVRVLELPYKGGRIAMDFILPDSGMFSDFESNFSAEDITGLLDKLNPTVLPPIRIPKFQFTTEPMSLTNAFKSLGMTAPFSNADFSGISDKYNLVISDIIHKAFIKVDEKGTEAAAATAIILGRDTTASSYPIFVADRPFIYLIRDTQTKAILFMGRVMDPRVNG
jgi:serpin B